MKRKLLLILTCCIASTAIAQPLRGHRLSAWGISAANYSGITPLGNNRYAVVSDKETRDGYYVWSITQNLSSGDIENIAAEGFYGQKADSITSQGYSKRDAEGIVYVPQRGTVFVSGEGDQQIQEYGLDGKKTGQQITIPEGYKSIHNNYGFEALAYDTLRQTYYTITENCLKTDGKASCAGCDTTTLLRLQAFDSQLLPTQQYAYLLDAPQCRVKGRSFAHGVVAMTALPDGKIAVLEREAHITQDYNKSKVWNKLYIVDPSESSTTSFDEKANTARAKAMKKKSIANWTTRFAFFDDSWANYEGMCLGQPTEDGRQTLILVSDSQGGFGLGPFRLKDWIRVVIVPNE